MIARSLLIRGLLVAVLMCCATQVQAQFLGHNTPGDFGLLSGTQAPPGIYLVAPMYVRYDSDTLRNGLGNSLPTDTDVAMKRLCVWCDVGFEHEGPRCEL